MTPETPVPCRLIVAALFSSPPFPHPKCHGISLKLEVSCYLLSLLLPLLCLLRPLSSILLLLFLSNVLLMLRLPLSLQLLHVAAPAYPQKGTSEGWGAPGHSVPGPVLC